MLNETLAAEVKVKACFCTQRPCAVTAEAEIKNNRTVMIFFMVGVFGDLKEREYSAY